MSNKNKYLSYQITSVLLPCQSSDISLSYSSDNLTLFILGIYPDTISSYDAEHSEHFKTIAHFDCRGVEITDFSPRVRNNIDCLFNETKCTIFKCQREIKLHYFV